MKTTPIFICIAIVALAFLLYGCESSKPKPELPPVRLSSAAPKTSPPPAPTAVDPAEPLTELAKMAKNQDGTNYIGVYLGMIAEYDAKGAVMMFSATSGQCLKWIPYEDFRDIFVLKTKPEYPRAPAWPLDVPPSGVPK